MSKQGSEIGQVSHLGEVSKCDTVSHLGEVSKCDTVSHLGGADKHDTIADLAVHARALASLGLEEFDVQACMEIAESALKLHNRAGLRLGCALVALKANLNHGEYLGALEQIGLNVRTAQRYAARWVWLQEQDPQGALRELSGKHLDATRKALPPGMALKELADDEGRIAGYTPDEIAAMSATEWADAIADLEGECVDLQKALDKERDRAADAENNADIARMKANRAVAQARPGHYDLPDYAAVARHEAYATCQQASLNLRQLRKVYEEQLATRADAVDDDERETATAAAAMQFHALLCVVQEGAELLERIRDAYPEVAHGWQPQYALSEIEQAAAQEARKVIFQRFEAQTKNRDTARKLADKSRNPSRGRPPKMIEEV